MSTGFAFIVGGGEETRKVKIVSWFHIFTNHLLGLVLYYIQVPFANFVLNRWGSLC